MWAYRIKQSPGLSGFHKGPFSGAHNPTPSPRAAPQPTVTANTLSPGAFLGDPGNVVVGGELGDVVIGIQELDHDIRRWEPELLWVLTSMARSWGRKRKTCLDGSYSAESLSHPVSVSPQHPPALPPIFSAASQLFLPPPAGGTLRQTSSPHPVHRQQLIWQCLVPYSCHLHWNQFLCSISLYIIIIFFAFNLKQFCFNII